MNDMNGFQIPEELLEGVNGGIDVDRLSGNAETALNSGHCPHCNSSLFFIAQSGNDNVFTYYGCPSCSVSFVKLEYFSSGSMWGQLSSK